MKLLALDIDETTLRHDGTLSKKNAEAIEYVRSSGGHAVIVTGRPPRGAYPIWEKLPCDDICVCFGGAVIVNMRTGEEYDSIYMDPYVLRDALIHAGKIGLVSQIYRDDSVMTEYANEYSDRYIKYLKLAPYEIVPDMQNMLHDRIVKMLCFSPEDELRKNMRSFTDRLGDRIGISASANYLIEINNPMANKGTGLVSLCRLLGIDVSESVAMGDSILDIPMIKAAGVGIAVKNSQPEVLPYADMIAPDCDDDAVAWVVERFFSR